MKRWIVLLILLAVLVVFVSGCRSGELTITDIWARSASAGQNGAIYFVIDNPTGQADTLLDIRGGVSDVVEVHLSQMDENGVMSMERQESVSVPARGVVEFKPGGLHVMLISLKNDLQIDDTFEITLVFQNAGEIRIQTPVGEQP